MTVKIQIPLFLHLLVLPPASHRVLGGAPGVDVRAQALHPLGFSGADPLRAAAGETGFTEGASTDSH